MIDLLYKIGPAFIGALVAAAALLVILTLMSLVQSRTKSNRLDSIMASYARAIGAGESAELEAPKRIRIEALDKFLRATDEKLAGAGIEVTAQTWTAGGLAVAAVVGVVSGIFIGNIMLGVLLGAITGYYLLVVYLGSRLKTRAKKFAEELPQVLAIIASGLRAGLTFASALSSTASQDQGEVGRQFRRAIAEVQFGSSIEDALRRVASRMGSADLSWLVLALEIQREVGGSLSTILDGVAETIKGRGEVEREVKVISAEGRMSGYVLIALPVVSFLALFVIRREYVSFFWTNPVGFVMIGCFVALMTIGWIWMNKAVAVRV